MNLSFKIKNIPVTIHPDFLIIVALLSLNRWQTPGFMISWVLVISFSIILHELGHALVASHFNHKPTIELKGIAGLTYLSPGENNSFSAQILITLGGPLTGIVIGSTVLLLTRLLPITNYPLRVILSDIIYVNLYWSLVNLLPVLPLDGGNISRLCFTRFLKQRGQLFAHLLSFLIIIPLGLYLLYTRNIFLAILAGYLAGFNINMFNASRRGGKDSHYNKDIARGYHLLQQDNAPECIDLCHRLLSEVRDIRVRRDVYRLLSRAYYSHQAYSEALRVLESLPEKDLEDERLLGFIYFALKEYKQAQSHFQKVIYSSKVEHTMRPYFLSLLKTGALDTAYDLATGFFHQNVDTDLLESLAGELHTRQFYDRALRINLLIFKRIKSPTAAYRAACALNRNGNKTSALKWLGKAVASGFSDKNLLQNNPELKDLQGMKELESLLEKIPTGKKTEGNS